MHPLTRFLRPGHLAALAAGAMVMTAGAEVAPTPVEELVIYGIDADTHELLRYTFDTDEFVRIGQVIDQNGFVLDHPECLTYIPSGPHRGFYAVPSGKDETGGPEHVLAKINGMDASCRVYSSAIGFEAVKGMVSVQNPLTNDWVIVAYAERPAPSLIAINPKTGLGAHIMNVSEDYEGLALHPNPMKLFGLTTDDLFEINLGGGETHVADGSDWSRMEALETAFGDFGPAIEIPGVDPTWTANGAVFGFSDSENALLVFNPAADEIAEYVCSFVTVDCEGLVFLTQLSDPYGKIVASAHD
ncbi:MAG: hypothetical protein ACYS0G_14270 [Planctomycetota bacterium]|jgi:hypothetical protein